LAFKDIDQKLFYDDDLGLPMPNTADLMFFSTLAFLKLASRDTQIQLRYFFGIDALSIFIRQTAFMLLTMIDFTQ
jgi:hypothetical protein